MSNNKDELLISKEKLTKLQKRLNHLKKEKKPKLSKELKKASEFGDLRENSEFLYAKDELNILNQKIKEIEHIVNNAKIISGESNNSNEIEVGSEVKVLDLENNQELFYKIVGSFESDPDKNCISHKTPIARKLLNKKRGENIKISTPGGEINYKILTIN
jgi:transcription elongation factor GreA